MYIYIKVSIGFRDQISARNCNMNCDADFGPDQLHDRIHLKTRFIFSVHIYAQEHTNIIYIAYTYGLEWNVLMSAFLMNPMRRLAECYAVQVSLHPQTCTILGRPGKPLQSWTSPRARASARIDIQEVFNMRRWDNPSSLYLYIWITESEQPGKPLQSTAQHHTLEPL